jgi:hypothetical protein
MDYTIHTKPFISFPRYLLNYSLLKREVGLGVTPNEIESAEIDYEFPFAFRDKTVCEKFEEQSKE